MCTNLKQVKPFRSQLYNRVVSSLHWAHLELHLLGAETGNQVGIYISPDDTRPCRWVFVVLCTLRLHSEWLCSECVTDRPHLLDSNERTSRYLALESTEILFIRYLGTIGSARDAVLGRSHRLYGTTTGLSGCRTAWYKTMYEALWPWRSVTTTNDNDSDGRAGRSCYSGK